MLLTSYIIIHYIRVSLRASGTGLADLIGNRVEPEAFYPAWRLPANAVESACLVLSPDATASLVHM